jgi:hypothetical protein
MKADMQSWKAANAGKDHEHADHADRAKHENPLEAFKADQFDAEKALSFGGHEADTSAPSA